MQTIKTLIVDDEEMIRNGIARLVRSCGEEWEIVAALSDGQEAMDYLDQSFGAIDLLITDVKMPVMDGLTLISEGKRRYSFFPLVISGYDEFQYIQSALREGAIDYFLKPIDREQFRKRMAEIKTKIENGRFQHLKLAELERKSEKLKTTEQIQLLSYVTSAGLDISRLGYWVDDFPKGQYILLYASLDALPVKTRSYTDKDWEAYGYVLENIMTEVVGKWGLETDSAGWCWRGDNSNFWILLCASEDENLEQVANELSGRIRSAVQSYTPFTVSLACGGPIEDLYLLPEAKDQALTLMYNRLLYGGNQLFSRDGMQWGADAGTGQTDAGLTAIMQRMKQAIEQLNADMAVQLNRELFEKLERTDSPLLIQRCLMNAFMLIHSIGFELKVNRYGIDTLEQRIGLIKRAINLWELRSELDHQVSELIGQIRQIRESGSMKPIEQAKAWIAANLQHDLAIKRIAEQVHMNPSYFCRHFKTQTGETILDYITGLRMAKAKELLANPHLKLYDISAQVGYQDVKYFSKLFKLWVGETPSKYREFALLK
ncbi:AraC family transcriptional regulator [Paenibacillus pasadenensis]|uniref:helix-turn-helix domain-containing protein n=1 Tax=Paenibacillus pasadenensis TaxID=217090 RepID=UPI00203CAEA6|nr:helix-turn-helix domain-containing protein [Paenibacillus pasadenensis]MCM3746123.1 AraC family transcriptional regulator [Paenibacillus pasadenensis]